MYPEQDKLCPLDVESIRKDFPVFASDSPVAYLDSAASSQTPFCVIEAMDDYYRDYRSNTHRGIYRMSEKATAQFEEAREKIARFINARRASQIFHT